jgi:signal transduction histidine kinase
LKNILFILISIIILSCTNKQKNQDRTLCQKDSIKTLLKSISENKYSKKQKLKKCDEVFELIKLQNNDTIKRNNYIKLILLYANLGEDSKAKGTNTILFNLSKQINDTLGVAKSYSIKGRGYLNNNINDSAFYYYSKAEKILIKIGDKKNLVDVYIKKAAIQFYSDDFLGGELSAIKALKVAKQINDKQNEYDALNILGVISFELSNYNKAIEYHKKALIVAEEIKFIDKNHLESLSLNNIGYTYQSENDNKKAIYYFKKALNNDKNLFKDYPSLYATIVDNIAYSNFKLNKLKSPDEFYKSLKIRDSLNLLSKVVYSKIHLSEFYLKNKNFNLAKSNAINALSDARLNESPSDILISLKQLSIADKKNTSKYSDEYIKISDSLHEAERKSKDKFARIAYETDEIIQEKDSLAERNRTLLYVFVVSFIIVVLLFVLRAQRARTRELIYKQAQQKANEDIYNLMMSQQAIIDESKNKEKKRLAQDLHDGVLGRMFGLRLNLDSLNTQTDEEAVKRRFELLNELKTIEQDIREISHDLNREKQVLINNFVSIVHNLLEEQKTAHDVNLTYSIDNNVNWDKIGNAIKINMYRMLQEGMQNINKYANAKNIFVEIKGDSENVTLTIKDDGVGFDVTRKSKGIGMQNMISRTHDCHGIIDISSKKDKGTQIKITLPIQTQPLTKKE